VQAGSVIFLRSAIFNVLFYLNLLVQIVPAFAAMFLWRTAMLDIARFWTRTNLWLLRAICDIDVEFRGSERIPPGPLLVACKHQSMWETFALLMMLPDPAYIMKRELMWIPFFGWYTWKAGMIGINRSRGPQALAQMTTRAREALAHKRQIVIFPEGTRRPPGAPPRYKHGVAHLYAELGARCQPIALNSGLFWPRRSWLRYPGTIRVEALKPIPAGLSKEVFFTTLQDDVETATARLLAEGERELAQRNIARSAAP
jgi:1-acyl-sn-glycerol-3-phosphate acyltransferase